MEKNKDAHLKSDVKEVIENCGLDSLVLDREVQINIHGERDDGGNYLAEKEIDVVAKFSYSGRKILLLFECENSRHSEVRKEYKAYDVDINEIRQHRGGIQVLNSADGRIQSRNFADVDIIRVCFVYGANFSEGTFQSCLKEAKKYKFVVLPAKTGHLN